MIQATNEFDLACTGREKGERRKKKEEENEVGEEVEEEERWEKGRRSKKNLDISHKNASSQFLVKTLRLWQSWGCTATE